MIPNAAMSLTAAFDHITLAPTIIHGNLMEFWLDLRKSVYRLMFMYLFAMSWSDWIDPSFNPSPQGAAYNETGDLLVCEITQPSWATEASTSILNVLRFQEPRAYWLYCTNNSSLHTTTLVVSTKRTKVYSPGNPYPLDSESNNDYHQRIWRLTRFSHALFWFYFRKVVLRSGTLWQKKWPLQTEPSCALFLKYICPRVSENSHPAMCTSLL